MNVLRALSLVAILALIVVGAPATMPPATASVAMSGDAGARGSGVAVKESASDDHVAQDRRRAEQELHALQARYRLLDGVTLDFGTTPNDAQAVAYYTAGRIVISRNHTVSVGKILEHEVWHVIDWRDNGKLDWGENLPPANTYAYVNR